MNRKSPIAHQPETSSETSLPKSCVPQSRQPHAGQARARARHRRAFRSGMSSWVVTFTMVAIAAAMVGLTVLIEMSQKTPKIEEFGRVGEEFFPEFVDPTLARELKVLAVDAARIEKVEFEVKQQENGLWVIPTHYNYPVDAEERLARTASAIVGLTRGAMVTRWATDHSRYGVIDPETAEASDEGIGNRITLVDDKGQPVVDLIVGKSVEAEASAQPPSGSEYYVRRPDEDEVYIADLNIDLSTRFSDWINTDLLELQPSDLIGLTVNNYRIDEEAQRIIQADVSELKQDLETSNWVLEGLNDPSAQVSQARVMTAVEALTNLKIVGVRPKVPGLRPDMSLDPRVIQSQEDFNRIRQDLGLRGLVLVPDESGTGGRLLSLEGELMVHSADGVVYTMYFGRAFTGGQAEIEIGSADGSDESTTTEERPAAEGDAASESTDGEAADGEATDSEAAEGEETPSAGTPGRFVFITALIDPEVIGEEPTLPAEPTRPAELDDPSLVPEQTENPDGGEPISRVDRLSEIKLQYDAQMQAYQLVKRQVEAYEARVKAAEDRVKEVNRRFGAWYYVISGEDFQSLTLDQRSLLEPKTAEEGPEGPIDPGMIPPGFPGTEGDSEFPTIPPRLPGSSVPGSGAPGSVTQPPSIPAPGSPQGEPAPQGEPMPEAGEPGETPAAGEPGVETPEAGGGEDPTSSDPTTPEPSADAPASEPPAAGGGEPSGGNDSP